MGLRLYGGIGRYELISGRERSPDTAVVHFFDRQDALRFLYLNLADPGDRALAARFVYDEGLGRMANRDLFELIANELMRGGLYIANNKLVVSPASTGDKPDEPKPGPGPGPGPKPKPTDKPAELVVTVKDTKGKPVEDAKVTATGLGSMQTDKKGVADYGTVKPGTYDVAAEKPGHSKTKDGPIGKDEKKDVSVPAGKKTKVDLVQHPSCANVAWFDGSTTRANYYGFDHKTDMEESGKKPYWDPVPAKGSLHAPGNKEKRDGARWVSVGEGKTAEVEINFAFKDVECIPCIGNSTYTVSPGKVAEVVTAKITAKKAMFKIKGLSKGEATLKVICDGNEIGWFHIWCAKEVKLQVDVAVLKTTWTSVHGYDIAALETAMNEIFRQCLIQFDLKDMGTIDLSGNAKMKQKEDTQYQTATSKFMDGTNSATWESTLARIDSAARDVLKARKAEPMHRKNARLLYWYIPDNGAAWAGMVPNIGGPAAFVFFGDSPAARNSAAHEMGHSLQLRHPSDGHSGSQFPSHCRDTTGDAVPEWPETNTEPKTLAHAAKGNVMGQDPTNLMGYWPNKPVRKYLRYRQWKAASRK